MSLYHEVMPITLVDSKQKSVCSGNTTQFFRFCFDQLCVNGGHVVQCKSTFFPPRSSVNKLEGNANSHCPPKEQQDIDSNEL